MALPSGADVKIGDIELKLFEDEEAGIEPYQHILEPEYARNTEGTPGVETIRAETKYWIRDDWSGGEGDKFYDAEFPNLYYESTDTNTRLPGSIKPRPTYAVTVSITYD